MSLYNAKSTEQPDTFLFTKFDDDLNIVDESVYLTSETECTCPAGVRPSCRHRQMLQSFLATSRIDTDWFFNHDTGEWSQPFGELDDSDVVIQPEEVAIEPVPDSPPSKEEWDQMTMAVVRPQLSPDGADAQAMAFATSATAPSQDHPTILYERTLGPDDNVAVEFGKLLSDNRVRSNMNVVGSTTDRLPTTTRIVRRL